MIIAKTLRGRLMPLPQVDHIRHAVGDTSSKEVV